MSDNLANYTYPGGYPSMDGRAPFPGIGEIYVSMRPDNCGPR